MNSKFASNSRTGGKRDDKIILGLSRAHPVWQQNHTRNNNSIKLEQMFCIQEPPELVFDQEIFMD
jgi:hypothetical protein